MYRFRVSFGGVIRNSSEHPRGLEMATQRAGNGHAASGMEPRPMSVTGDMITKDGGKTRTVDTIHIPQFTFSG